MKTKITQRDVKFFLLGIFTLFIFNVISDWDENVKAFQDGLSKGISNQSSQ